ncbi:hypothetical protein BJ912DRAFT_945678 [Pholiota molesta]|nr:hypothetical protein BJ912DRAFT_945678 [Pholiota molesta]
MLRSHPLSAAKLVAWLAAALSVLAQSSDVIQCINTYEWAINSEGQTPCLVAAYLESACGRPTQVNAVPVNNQYLGPNSTQQNPCLCSSVTYSLVSACGGCQARNFQNWTTWSMDCINPSLTTFPEQIPSNVMVPKWAFLNLTLTGDTFDPVAAQNVLQGVLPPTTSLVSTTPAVISASEISPSPTMPVVTSTKSHSNAGGIAGGVVGGLVLLAAIAIAVLWWIMRKRRNTVQKDLTFDSRALMSTSPIMSQQTGSSRTNNGPSPAPFSSPLYGTSRSTFPTSPVTSAVFTTPATGSRRSMESISHSLAHFGSQQAYTAQHPGYRGAAEV